MALKLKRSKWKRFVKYCANQSCKKISGRQILGMLFWTRFAMTLYLFAVNIVLFRVILVGTAMEVLRTHNLLNTPFWFLCGIWMGTHVTLSFVYLCVLWIGFKKECQFFLKTSAVFAIISLIEMHGFGFYLCTYWYTADNLTIMEYTQPALWFSFMFFFSLAEIYFCAKYSKQLNSRIVDKIIEEYHTFDDYYTDYAPLVRKDKNIINSYSFEEPCNSKCNTGGAENGFGGTVHEVNLDVFMKFMVSPWEVKSVKTILGKGNFGIVSKGYLKRDGSIIPVALKTSLLKESQDLALFVKEIKVMIYVGNHENIVKFYGITSDASIDGHLTIIMEYCLTTLQKYLMDNKSLFSLIDYNDLFNTGIQPAPMFVKVEKPYTKEYGVLDLLQFAQQIASGMKFIASKNIVHGDLSLKNILMTKDNCVKITDFGISVKLYDKLYHRSLEEDGAVLFPWRWSSIEVMTDLKFSEKSDIWSWGICCWELFTLGSEIPYGNIDWSPDILTLIKSGYRLGKPDFVNDEIYNLMLCCWEPEADNRPSFKDIYSMISLTIKQFKSIK